MSTLRRVNGLFLAAWCFDASFQKNPVNRLACLACGGGSLENLVDLGSSPTTTGALHHDIDGARSVRCGRIDLAACRDCGHVTNEAFEPALVEYDGSYDNSLHFSPVFQRYADGLASRLVTAYGLQGKHIVEIGSGRGDFLAALTALTAGTGTGYDPSYSPNTAQPGVTLVPEYFRPEHAIEGYALLVCRHVVEHLDEPFGMLSGLRATAPQDSVFYLEVPAGEFCFGPSGLWDCIYPHVSYFCQTSLRVLVERSGFEVLAEGAAFDGQFLWVEARPSDSAPSRLADHEVGPYLESLRGFSGRWNAAVSRWRQHFDHRRRSAGTGRSVLWGAGSKAVTFLNAVDPGECLEVVDLSPRKWGRYLPRTGHVIQCPDTLIGESITEVLITNPVYGQEIADHLQRIGVSAPIVPV